MWVKKLFFLVLCIGSSLSSAFATNVALFTTERMVNENHGQIKAVEIICDVAGFPVDVITETEFISNYDVLFLVGISSASSLLLQTCDDFIRGGGILFADYYSNDNDLLRVFSLAETNKNKAHYNVILDKANFPQEMKWLDDPLEQMLVLTNPNVSVYNVFELECEDSYSIAQYEDGSNAITKCKKGDGYAYYIGFPLTRVVLNPRLLRHNNKKRDTDGFEPNADIIPLLVRGVVELQAPAPVWKYTIPAGEKSAFILTHDVDALVSMDTTFLFSNYEKQRGITAHYFVTTRYFKDLRDADYYNFGKSKTGSKTVKHLIDLGFSIGSHSVGHFPDFNDAEAFPIGDVNIVKEDYSPYNDGKTTTGGTVMGELSVSRAILEEDGASGVNTFRSGHLAYNKHLPLVADSIGYAYMSNTKSSSYSQTGFPYRMVIDNKSYNPYSNCFEIPYHFSDVFKGDEKLSMSNYKERVDTWLTNFEKQTNNYTAAQTLVHPTRMYKILSVDYFLNNIPHDVCVLNFERHGTFWKDRYYLDFDTKVKNNCLYINLKSNVLNDDLSLVISDGKDYDRIFISSTSGIVPDYYLTDWEANSRLLRFGIAKNIINKSLDLVIDEDDLPCLIHGRYYPRGTISGVYKSTSSSTMCDTVFSINMTVLSKPEANFTADIKCGQVPVVVNFKDVSTDRPSSWSWDFGDGGSSFQKNPKHEYKKAGLYDVRLKVVNKDGADVILKKAYVVATEIVPKPIADFSVDKTQISPFTEVQFINKSKYEGGTFFWNFGDGHTSEELNPKHTYSQDGKYNVSLIVSNSAGSDEVSKKAFITVSTLINVPHAKFSSEIVSGTSAFRVQFYDKTPEDVNCWFWDFGDGCTAVEQHPIHTYKEAGSYPVSLVVKNCVGSDALVKANCVKVTKKITDPRADFKCTRSRGEAPLVVTFTDKSSDNAKSWLWDFGDRTTSKEQNPYHIYRSAGVYSVTLTVKNESGSSVVTKAGFINVVKSTPCDAGYSCSLNAGGSTVSSFGSSYSIGQLISKQTNHGGLFVCEGVQHSYDVSVVSELLDSNNGDGFKANVFPNPVSDYVTIKVESEIHQQSSLSYSLYNAQGEVLLSAPIVDEVSVDLSSLSPGVYLIAMLDEQRGLLKAFKIIKK